MSVSIFIIASYEIWTGSILNVLLFFKFHYVFVSFLCSKDYEEDFEEMDQSENESKDEKEQEFPEMGEKREELVSQKRKEIEAIQRAMNEENERVGTTQSRQSTSREEEDTSKRSKGLAFLYFLNLCTCLMLKTKSISDWKTLV